MKRIYTTEYKNWIKKIFSRDKHKCQWPYCDKHYKLNAHHINKWSDFPGLRFHLNNGITLCKYHHDLIKGMEESYAPMFFKIVSNNKDSNYDNSKKRKN
jgi:hypothetical protein